MTFLNVGEETFILQSPMFEDKQKCKVMLS